MGPELSEISVDFLLEKLLEEYESESEDAVAEGKGMKKYTGPNKHELKNHKKAKEALKGKRAEILRELLEAGRDIIQCRQEYGQLYNSRSVFSKLPNEVVALIFTALVAGGRATGVPPDPLPEIALSHVCSHWRRLALATPSLWSFFRFDGAICHDVPEERIAAYLERSQDKPFDLWLRLATDHDQRESEKDLACILFQQAHRLRLCRLQADDEGLVHELFPIDEAAPMLQVLSMVPLEETIDWADDVTLEEWKPAAFRSGASSLKYVHLDDRSLSYFMPPLTSVVHLRLECELHANPYTRLSTAALDHILTLPQLQSFSIRGAFFALTARRRGPAPIRNRSLKHVRFGEIDLDDRSSVSPVDYFLANVHASALQSITIEKLESSEEEDKAINEPDRFPSLRILALRDPYVTLHGLHPLFSAVPTLRHLVWSITKSRRNHREWMDVFMEDLERSNLLPHLEQITIDGKLAEASDVRRQLVAAFPNLETLKVRKEYADALLDKEEAEDMRKIKITTIEPTEFPSEGWIHDPGWIEVGDGTFSGWEYYNCLNLD